MEITNQYTVRAKYAIRHCKATEAKAKIEYIEEANGLNRVIDANVVEEYLLEASDIALNDESTQEQAEFLEQLLALYEELLTTVE